MLVQSRELDSDVLIHDTLYHSLSSNGCFVRVIQSELDGQRISHRERSLSLGLELQSTQGQVRDHQMAGLILYLSLSVIMAFESCALPVSRPGIKNDLETVTTALTIDTDRLTPDGLRFDIDRLGRSALLAHEDCLRSIRNEYLLGTHKMAPPMTSDEKLIFPPLPWIILPS
jgi:hypothetical protein